MGLERLETDAPTVFVSLPRNDPDLARAAINGGADGVKIHLNATHGASGRTFGSVEEEAETILAIGEIDVPLGVVPGQDAATVRETLPALSDLPVDFVDAHAHHLPLEALEANDLATWVAPSETYTLDEVDALQRVEADALEVGVLAPDEYGRPFTVSDAAAYLDLVERSALPVIVPTQFELRPADAAYLADRGVTNFLLGTVVMDATPASVEETTAAFVDALE